MATPMATLQWPRQLVIPVPSQPKWWESFFFSDYHDCETNTVLTILFLGSGWRDSEEGGSSSLYKGIAQCSLKELLIKIEWSSFLGLFKLLPSPTPCRPNFVHFAGWLNVMISINVILGINSCWQRPPPPSQHWMLKKRFFIFHKDIP